MRGNFYSFVAVYESGGVLIRLSHLQILNRMFDLRCVAILLPIKNAC